LRTFGKTILTLGALCLPPARPTAQGRGGFAGVAACSLSTNARAVQKELKLTDDQISKVREIRRISREVSGQAPRKPARRRTVRQSMKITQDDDRELRKAMADVFKPETGQAVLRDPECSRWARCVNMPEVQKKIVLTDDQKDKLRVVEESQTQQREIFRPPRTTGEGAMKKLADLPQGTLGKVTALPLAADQKKTWKEMTGEPFEVKVEPAFPITEPDSRAFGLVGSAKCKRDRDPVLQNAGSSASQAPLPSRPICSSRDDVRPTKRPLATTSMSRPPRSATQVQAERDLLGPFLHYLMSECGVSPNTLAAYRSDLEVPPLAQAACSRAD